MRLTKINLSAGFVVAAMAVSLSVGSAVAEPTTGSVAPAIVNYTGGGTSSVTVTNVGSLSIAGVTCTGFTAPGVVQLGGHAFAPATPPGGGSALDAVLTIGPPLSFSGCTNPVVGSAAISASSGWKFGVVSKATGTATGYLDFVQLHIAAATCSYDVTGYVPGTYSNSTGNFVTSSGAGLVISNVTGSACVLVHIANGQVASMTGTLHVNPPFVIS